MTTSLNLLRDPQLWSLILVFWLLPCAWQDYRTRRVSNWLTVPLFLLAWPLSLLLDTSLFTFAVFLGFYAAFHLTQDGMGGADGKVATGLAAIAPLGLLLGLVFSELPALLARVRRQPLPRVAGAVFLYFGAVCAYLLQVAGVGIAWLKL